MPTIVHGTLVHIPFKVFDADNARLDMTSSDRVVALRLKSGSTVLTRTTATSGHRTWTDQANGEGYFIIAAADNTEANLPVSANVTAEAKYSDASSLDVKRVLTPETWVVVDPETGAF